MRLPNIANYSGGQYANDVQSIIEFKGYNARIQPSEGEFVEMTNLTSDYYPCLSPRSKREKLLFSLEPQAFHTADGVFCVVADQEFHYGDDEIGPLNDDFPKRFVNFQSKIIIFPDKVFFDTKDQSVPLKGLQAIDSEYETIITESLEFYNNDTGDGMIISSISTIDFADYFSAGDAIVITGCTNSPNNNKSVVIKRIDGNTMYFEPGTFEVNIDGGVMLETDPIILSRNMPDMDFVCSHNNRLWGVKGDTIYSSKLGSLTNWNYYQGLSNDSWSVDVSSEGDFTGCIGFGNAVMFFKENVIHKLYLASKPSGYQIVDINCMGLGLVEGSEKSLSILANTLYYKSRTGVVMTTGGTPELISEGLGDANYIKAVACNDGRKYYISMMKAGLDAGSNLYNLFVYDTEKGMWHREDDAHVVDFGYQNVENITIYFLNTDNEIWSMNKLLGDGEDPVEWSATLAEFSEYVADKKGYSKLQMRVDVASGSNLKVHISTDGGAYVKIFDKTSIGNDSFQIPIAPNRCNRFKIKLSGAGDCKIYGITRVFKYGSDMR